MPKLIRCGEYTVRGSILLSDEEGHNSWVGTKHIIACYGLAVQGIVLPSSDPTQRVLTRSAFYYYPELPKVFHFYMGINEKISTKDLFATVDEYLFAYNCRYPESRLHGKAKRSESSHILEDRYLPADPEVWIHNPMWAMNSGRGPEGYHWASDEEVNCGANLFDHPWQQYIKTVTPLMNCVVGVHEKIMPFTDPTKLSFCSADNPYSNEEVRHSCMLHHNVDPEKVTTFQPMIANRQMYISYNELKEFASKFPDFLGYFKEKKPNILRDPTVLQYYQHDETCLNDAIRMHGLPQRSNNPDLLPRIEYIYTNKYHDQSLLAYFIDGLAASRYRTAFLCFYQVLERKAHYRKEKDAEKKALRRLIDDTTLFRNCDIANAFAYAEQCSGGLELQKRLCGKSGRWKRKDIADVLYKETRNPLIHAKDDLLSGNQAKASANNTHSSIIPFSREENDHAIEARMVLCRELARVVVLKS
ncbi:MAG: hypothetical protein K9K39_01385 [Desulfohalobiaceae bacterium]|nr:hypothetical protein [Desulfohalobiaceae bacterium]